MVKITIRLVGGMKDKLIKNFELDPQIHVHDLVEKIEMVTNIPPPFQEITFRGVELPECHHPLVSMIDSEELVVEHSMTENWKVFVACFELAQQALATKQFNEIEHHVDMAMGQLKRLTAVNYFATFPHYYVLPRQFKADFLRYWDKDFRFFEFAVELYFRMFFVDSAECPAVKIKCEKKAPEESGVQGGVICQVFRSEVLLGKYYVKEHIGRSHSQHADLREIFVYKLFELIQVGPVVHFIPNTHFSNIGLYIGTEEVVGFRRADADEVEISKELHAQRDLLRRVLFVEDLHSKNYGIDGNGRLSIVDFQIKCILDSTMVYKYLDEYKSFKGSRELRIRVAKESIDSWNLLGAFDRANTAIVNQKELFKRYSISYKPSRNFDEYFVQIKNNLSALVEYLK